MHRRWSRVRSGVRQLQGLPRSPSKIWPFLIKVLQGNLNRSRTAQNLLAQICLEKNADVVIVSEQYRGSIEAGWYRDVLGTAAIWIPDTRRHLVSHHGSGRGYVWVRCSQINFISCYLTPTKSIGDFQAKLDCLEDSVIDMEGDLIVTGDFNAKALEWGERQPSSRG